MDKAIIKLINDHEYETAVEVGVRHAYTSKQLVNDTCLKEVYGVDIRWDAKAASLQRTSTKYKYIVNSSIETSRRFKDEYLDFIYIDADHSYEQTLADLKCWFPKLKPGGLMCGDDYLVCNNPTEGEYGVEKAVEEFCNTNGLDVHIVNHPDLNSNERHSLAKHFGKQVEDNLWLIHSYLFSEEAMLGRVRTEEAEILNWYFYKKEADK